MHPRNCLSTSVIFCVSAKPSVNCRQLSVYPWDHHSNSVNFSYVHRSFHQLPTTFLAFTGHSPHFRHFSVRLRRIPLSCVNFQCFHGPLRQLPSIFRASAAPSVNIPYVCRTFRQLASTFRASMVHIVNFRQFTVHLREFPFTSVKLPCILGAYREHPSNFCPSTGTSVNFCASRDPPFNFPFGCGSISQLFEHPQDLLSTSVNFP